MKFARSLAAALLCGGLIVSSAMAGDLQNAIGIYHPQPNNTDDLETNTNYLGQPGAFQAYVVLVDPYNENTGAAIANLGGFEFKIDLPGNVYLMGHTMHTSCANFMSPPEFLVGSNIPVRGDMVTLITLDLSEFAGTTSFIYLKPVSIPSIAGSLAIADADDAFSISEAVPSSGALNEPVFDLYFEPAVDEATWGEVKTLFKR